MAVRKIPKNYLNVTGRLAGSPISGQSGFESLLEKDYLLSLQFDDSVEHFEVQSVQVPVPGRRRPYTPDVLVRYRPGPRGGRVKPDLIEVKPRSILERKADELAPKFAAARSFARAQGWNFRIVTEEHISTQRLQNIKFLREYRRRPPDPEREAIVIDTLNSLGPGATSTSLVRALEPSGNLEQAGTWYAVVWRLVYSRRIRMDFDAPMAESVSLWLAVEGAP
jgi:hypothetical protein